MLQQTASRKMKLCPLGVENNQLKSNVCTVIVSLVGPKLIVKHHNGLSQ